MTRSKLVAVLCLLLVFASGIVVGAVAHRLYTMNSVSANSPDEFRRKYVAEMRARLKLTSDQEVKLNEALDLTRQRYHAFREAHRNELNAIQQEQVSRINSFLNEGQRLEYAKIRAEREKEQKHAR